jgi:hypothetical protein
MKFLNWLRKVKCKHDWKLKFVHVVTGAPLERHCTKCSAIQRAETVWCTVNRGTI